MSAHSPDGNAVKRSKAGDSVAEDITLRLAGCNRASILVASLDSTVQQLKEVIAATLGGAAAPLLPDAP